VFRKLKRKKKTSEMKRKLAEWKKQGFNVDEFLTGISKPEQKISKEDREKSLGEWKKQGYDVGVLGK